MSSEDEQDSTEYLRPMEKIKDPRQFFFAIICNVCRYRCGTLQEMRLHVTRNCPVQLRKIELFCGHCGQEFYKWPEIVEHLNQKDMHNQPEFRSEYVFPAEVRPDMTPYLSQSETLQYHRQRTHCRPPFRPPDAPPSEDILATAIRTAGIPAATISTVTSAPQPEESPPPQAIVVPFLEEYTQGGDIGEVAQEPPLARDAPPPPLPPVTNTCSHYHTGDSLSGRDRGHC